MRLGLCLFSVFLIFQGLLAQSASYSFELKRSTGLVAVLSDLQQDYGLVFSYTDRLAEQVKIVPCRITASTIEEFLEAFCTQNELEYRFSDQGDVLLRAKLQPKLSSSTPDQWLLSGKVIDQKGQPIQDVAVYLDTLQLGTLTDADGIFEFTIPYYCKNRTVVFQLLGYERSIQSIRALEEQAEVQLRAISLSLDPVTITESVPRIQQLQADGGIKLTSIGGQAPGSVVGDDIFRTVQLLPGVSAHDDLSAAIKIRGSSSDETLVVLDGIPIYKAEHYFGVFSAINSTFVQNTTLFKNALPAAYGGKTGGMLLMNSNDGLYNRLGAEVDVNLLTTSALVQAPMGKRSALVLSARTTYKDAATNPIFDAFSEEESLAANPARENFTRPELLQILPSFQFYDINARWIYQLNARSRLNLNYYQSNDDLSNDYENSFRARVAPNRFAENNERFSSLENWSNQGASLNYDFDLSDTWQLNSNTYYTKYENRGRIYSELTRDLRLGGEVQLWDFENIQNNLIEDFGTKLQFSRGLPNDRNLNLGLELIQHNNEFELREEERTTLQSNTAAYETSIFSGLPIINQPNFYLDLGNRLTYYSRTKGIYWSPRLSFLYRLQPQLSLKGAFTHSNQFVREFVHNNRLGQSLSFFTLSNDDKYPIGVSDNFMLGGSWKTGPWSFDLELYAKYFNGVIEHARVFQGFDPDEVKPGELRAYAIFNGSGQTHGLDFLLTFEKESFDSWLSYTLSKTTHQFDAIYRGLDFPSEDDRRHQLSWVNNYQWNALNFSATYVMASGRPYINLLNLDGPNDLREIDPMDLLDRLPAYHRLDLGLSYQFDWKWTQCSLGATLFNVTNRQNVKYRQFVFSVPYERRENEMVRNVNQVIGNTTGMLNRTLNLSFKVQF